MVERPRTAKPPLAGISEGRRPRPASLSFLNLPPASRHLTRTSPRLSSPSSLQSEPLLPSSPPPPSSAPSSSSSFFHRLFPSLLLAGLLVVLAALSTSALVRSLPRFRRPPSAEKARLSTGYAVVAACRNRHHTLEKAARSWMRVQGARQVVLVDWASEPPLRTVIERVLGENNRTEGDVPEVTVVRVEGENDWVLTRAYNLGVRHAMFDYVFKVDCDYVVGERAIVRHPLTEDAGDVFFTGYYMNARDANEMHLNGALVVSQRRFWAVGGYDERVQSYGYDDEDLYKRLLHAGMKRLNVSYDQVRHIEHADKSRAQEGVKFPRVQIDMNSLLLEKIDRPWEKSDRASEYERVPGRADTVRAVYVPPTLESLVEKGVRDELWKLSVARRLRDEYRIPWGVISSMEVGEAEKLLENMNRRKVRAEYDEVRHTGLAVRFVLVHVQNGLGNRLRVLASGLSFADRTGREPIIVWEKDVHFRGFYSDIFNATQTKFAVLDTFQPKWPLAPHAEFDEAWKDIEFYNYLIKEDVGNEIVDDEKKNIYFKSSAIMNSRVTTWESENEQLRNLKVHGYITGMATRISNAGNFKNVGGVHIRNRSLEDDIIGVKDNHGLYDKDDAAEIEKWRATTKYTSFVDEMKALLKNGTVDKFFVATDAVDVLGTMEGLFPEGKILFITRDCDDRGGRCEQFAMADLLVLSRTKVLLGSTWSSFTEAAMRLGGPKALMAGTDFGIPPKTTPTPILSR